MFHHVSSCFMLHFLNHIWYLFHITLFESYLISFYCKLLALALGPLAHIEGSFSSRTYGSYGTLYCAVKPHDSLAPSSSSFQKLREICVFASWALIQLAKVNCAWKWSMTWAQKHSVLVDFGSLTSKQSCRRSLTRNSCLIAKPRVQCSRWDRNKSNPTMLQRSYIFVLLCFLLGVMLQSEELKLCCFKASLLKLLITSLDLYPCTHIGHFLRACEYARVEFPAHGSAALHS